MTSVQYIIEYYSECVSYSEMKIQTINPGPDFVGIQVGQNSIVLPTSELQDALNYSSGNNNGNQSTSQVACMLAYIIFMTFTVKEVSFLFKDLSTSLLDK